jgi:hypothetical protein
MRRANKLQSEGPNLRGDFGEFGLGEVVRISTEKSRLVSS